MWIITKVCVNLLFPVGIYLFNVNNKNTENGVQNMSKINKKDTRTTSIDRTNS